MEKMLLRSKRQGPVRSLKRLLIHSLQILAKLDAVDALVVFCEFVKSFTGENPRHGGQASKAQRHIYVRFIAPRILPAPKHTHMHAHTHTHTHTHAHSCSPASCADMTAAILKA